MKAITYGMGHVHVAGFQQEPLERGLFILLPGCNGRPQLEDARDPAGTT